MHWFSYLKRLEFEFKDLKLFLVISKGMFAFYRQLNKKMGNKLKLVCELIENVQRSAIKKVEPQFINFKQELQSFLSTGTQ